MNSALVITEIWRKQERGGCVLALGGCEYHVCGWIATVEQMTNEQPALRSKLLRCETLPSAGRYANVVPRIVVPTCMALN